MDLNNGMQRFRLASREVRNHFFHPEAPGVDPCDSHCAFSLVQEALFRALVLQPAALQPAAYGDPIPGIRVHPDGLDSIPAMVNREYASGYWDHPTRHLTTEAELVFVSFFDWDESKYADHQYTRVLIAAHATQPELIGRHALVQTRHVRFAVA